jgi:SulP family sulfate permease
MHYRNVERFPEVEQRPDVLILRFDAQLYFANAGYLRDKVNQLMKKKGEDLRLVVLNAESISFIDSSAIHVLGDMVNELRAQGVQLVLAGVIGPVRDILYRSGLSDLLGEDAMFVHCSEAVDYYDQSKVGGESSGEYRLHPRFAEAARQTNLKKQSENGE